MVRDGNEQENGGNESAGAFHFGRIFHRKKSIRRHLNIGDVQAKMGSKI